MINIKVQELNDIVYEPNHEHLKLPTNENTKNENDGHKPHSLELFQLIIQNISYLFGYLVLEPVNGEFEQHERFLEKLQHS